MTPQSVIAVDVHSSPNPSVLTSYVTEADYVRRDSARRAIGTGIVVSLLILLTLVTFPISRGLVSGWWLESRGLPCGLDVRQKQLVARWIVDRVVRRFLGRLVDHDADLLYLHNLPRVQSYSSMSRRDHRRGLVAFVACLYQRAGTEWLNRFRPEYHVETF